MQERSDTLGLRFAVFIGTQMNADFRMGRLLNLIMKTLFIL